MTGTKALAGKVAVVTGGSRGLGKEIVTAFAKDGANVIIASRKIENCITLAEEVEKRYGVQALPYQIHMGDWSAQAGLVDTVVERFGRLDILVNNAGMSPVYPSLEALTEELFDKIMAVNLKGAFRLSIEAARVMRKTGGSIINISSIASERTTAGDLPYGIAKSGINLMTKAFAAEFGPSIRVNTIMCGAFATDISKAWDMDMVEEKMKALPLERVGHPEEVVGAARYFATDISSYTTGSVLAVDGGRVAMGR